MFEEVTLIAIKQEKNVNGEVIEHEKEILVPIVEQKVSREQRDKNNERGLGSTVRFSVQFFGPGYNAQNIPYFIYQGVRYSVTDFTKDRTQTEYFIEGTTVKGKV